MNIGKFPHIRTCGRRIEGIAGSLIDPGVSNLVVVHRGIPSPSTNDAEGALVANEIPVRPGESKRLRPAPLPLAGQLSEARVLIVDDNQQNIALLVAILKRAGYRNLFTELDSRLVAGRLEEIDPDLVMLDLNMPYVDGFAVLEQIRRYAPAEAVPVLVLTAETTPTASERALRAGAQDFMTKPFSNGEVLVRAQNLLRLRFMYTTLRSSILRERESAVKARWLSTALNSEQENVERLQHLDDLKDILLQTVSHDLRNPIWAVLLVTDLLAQDADGTQPLDPDLRRSLIAKATRSARQMEQLLADILDSDPMRTVDQTSDACDVGEVVSRVLAEVDLGRDHPLHTDLQSVTAQVDPVHLERIVENLLNNARQHLAQGVPIWVSVSADDGGAVIAVEDGGPGIPPAIADTIFEPFRRGDTSGSGLGLGLSLVSRFAELHGGRAWTEDRPGGGASFKVFLPSADSQGPAVMATA